MWMPTWGNRAGATVAICMLLLSCHAAHAARHHLNAQTQQRGACSYLHPELLSRALEHNASTLASNMLESLLHKHHDGIWMQVGSNVMDFEAKNPMTAQYDPFSHHLRKFDNYQKIFVEAVPDLFEQMRKNTANLPNTLPLNVAILGEEGPDQEVPIYCFPPEEWVDWRAGCCSFSEEIIRGSLDNGRVPHKVMVHGASLKNTLAAHVSDLGQLRILLVDTEGFDYHILTQLPFGQPKFHPPLIVFEDAYMSLEQVQSIKRMLWDNCYATVKIDVENILAISLLD